MTTFPNSFSLLIELPHCLCPRRGDLPTPDWAVESLTHR